MWILLTYILGCAGPDCEVPDYNSENFNTEEECWEALEEWQGKGEDYVGICIESKSPKAFES